MDTIHIIGFIAGALTTISFLPQVIRSWKLKETRDFSFLMLILFCSGIFLWIIYGFGVDSIPIILANVVTIILIMILIMLKLKYG